MMGAGELGIEKKISIIRKEYFFRGLVSMPVLTLWINFRHTENNI